MNTKKTYFIIGLSSLAVIGLVIIQMHWLQTGIKLHQQIVEEKMCVILKKVNTQISETPSIHTEIIEGFKKQKKKGSVLYAGSLGKADTEIRVLLDSLLKAYRVGLSDYEYHIDNEKTSCANCFKMGETDTHTFYQINLDETINHSIHQSCLSTGSYQLRVNFPHQYYYLVKQVSNQLVIALILLALLFACFIHTLLTLFRQKRLDSIKNDFINNLTHELKTPLFSISLLTKVFKTQFKKVSEKKSLEYIELIENENEQLKNQVEKVLQIAMMEHKKIHLELQEVDLNHCIQTTARPFQFIADQKNGAIKLSLEAQNTKIYADKTHIVNLIYNLLDNALKYSKEIPRVEIRTEDREGGIHLIVKDQGVGIQAKDKKQIFEKFYRVSTGNTHNVKGFGLGLSYVKMIVEAHKGVISLQSQWKKGTEFHVYLPG